MKRSITLLILLSIANFLLAQASIDEGRMQIGLQGNINTYLAFMDDNDNGGILSPGIEGFFDYKFTNNFALNFGLGYNQIKIDYPTVLTNNLLTAAIKGKLFLFKTKKLNPFIDLGVGVFSFTQDNGYFTDTRSSSYITGGIGAEISLNERFNLIPSINYHITQDDLDNLPNFDSFLDDEFVSVGLGISIKFGQAKEEAILPEPIKIIKPVEEKPVEVVEEKPVEVVEEKVEIVEEVEVVEEVQVVEEKVEVVEETTESLYYDNAVYMIKPNECLYEIARKIYKDQSAWKDIYNCNKESIGNNPDIIQPFNELKLENVSKENMENLVYTYYDYKVLTNETLVDIAAKEYGNKYAWIVVYRDNKDILKGKYAIPSEGTILKLRSKLFNQE